MGTTRANKNREVRKENYRELLSNQGHLQVVIENVEKLEDLETELDSSDVQRLNAAIGARMKLIDKYVPSLKSVEYTNEDGEVISPIIGVQFVGVKAD